MNLAVVSIVFVAGGVGALARWAIARALYSDEPYLPWGTLVANVVGCVLFGVLWVLLARYDALGDRARLALLVGFMGSFTTFSTFAFETGDLLMRDQLARAGWNVLAQNGLGVGGFLFGAWITRAAIGEAGGG